jgi:hypothetical protein
LRIENLSFAIENQKRKITMNKLLSSLALLVCLALPALADNFNITNVLQGGVSIVSYPTNTPLYVTNSTSSNYVGVATGGAIGLANNNFATFDFQCLPNASAATGTCVVTIQFVRSTAGQAPGALVATNPWTGGTNIMQNDWETTPPGGPLTVAFNVTGTNAVNWMTNWIDPQLAGAGYIGVYSITNATTNAILLTNCVATLSKKIIPIRYP